MSKLFDKLYETMFPAREREQETSTAQPTITDDMLNKIADELYQKLYGQMLSSNQNNDEEGE